MIEIKLFKSPWRAVKLLLLCSILSGSEFGALKPVVWEFY